MYVLLCSLHSICRFLFNYSIKVIVVLTTFSIISIPYLLNSVLQPYFMPIYSIILLYLFICNMSHVLEINYLILSYLIRLVNCAINRYRYSSMQIDVIHMYDYHIVYGYNKYIKLIHIHSINLVQINFKSII